MIEFVTGSCTFYALENFASDAQKLKDHLNAKILRRIRQGKEYPKLFNIFHVKVYAVSSLPQLSFLREALKEKKNCSFVYSKFPPEALEAARKGVVPLHAQYEYTPLVHHVFDAFRDPEYGPVLRATWGDLPSLDSLELIDKSYTRWIQQRERVRQKELMANKGQLETVWCSLDRKSDVVKLLDQAALDHEGYVMKHCVSRYSSVLGSSNRWVLSLRVDGKSVATAEYSEGFLVQSKGKLNSSVTGDVQSLFRSLQSNLRVTSRVQAKPEAAVQQVGRGRVVRPGLEIMQRSFIEARDLDEATFYREFDQTFNTQRLLAGSIGHLSTFRVMDSDAPMSYVKSTYYEAFWTGRQDQKLTGLPTSYEDSYSSARLFLFSVGYRFLDALSTIRAVVHLYSMFKRSNEVNFRGINKYLEYGELRRAFPDFVTELLKIDSEYNKPKVLRMSIESFSFPCEDKDVRQTHAPSIHDDWFTQRAKELGLKKLDYLPTLNTFSVPGYLGVSPLPDLLKGWTFVSTGTETERMTSEAANYGTQASYDRH